MRVRIFMFVNRKQKFVFKTLSSLCWKSENATNFHDSITGTHAVHIETYDVSQTFFATKITFPKKPHESRGCLVILTLELEIRPHNL